MPDPTYPRINNQAHDGASVKVRIGKSYFRGIQSITYGDALEPNYVYELGSTEPIAQTVGQYKPDDIALEVLRERADAIRAALRQQYPKARGWGRMAFPIIVHYDDGNVPVSDEIVGCRVIKVGNDAKNGADALVEKWTIRPMSLNRNGFYLYK